MAYNSGMFADDINRLNITLSQFDYADLDSSWQSSEESFVSSFTRIYLILEGEAEITYNGVTTKLCAGNVYVVPSYGSFTYRCDSRIKKLYIHISAQYDNYLDIFSKSESVYVFPHMEKEISEIYSAFMNENMQSFLQVKAFIFKTVFRCFANEPFVMNDATETVRKATAYISENLSSRISVSEISSALFISSSKLQSEFKKCLGMSVGKYVDMCLANAAEDMLAKDSLSIGEISEKLGFCDQFYFSRFFSKKFGMSPHKYRQTSNFGK